MSTDITRRDLLRYGSIGAGGIALFGITAACSTGTATTGATTAAASAKATNFKFASWGLSEDATKPVLQAAIDSFAGSRGVSVATSSYPFNDYLNQFILQVRAGQFTGAAQLDVAWLASLAALGKLEDLSGLAVGRGYTDAALKAGQVDGKQLALPWTIGAIGLITNTELLTRAGVTTAPVTIADFEANLRAIKGLGVIPYAASTKVAQLKDIIQWMQTFGSPIIENGKTTIGDDGSIKAVTWYKKLFDDGLIAPDIDRAGARALFAQGKTAMYDDAPVGKAGVVKQSPDKALSDKMAPMTRPVLASGDPSQQVLWGHLVTVISGDGAGTAGQFAQWLTSDSTQTVDYFTKLGLPPTTTSALDSSAVTANTFVADFTTKVTAHAKASPLWPYLKSSQMEAALADQVQAVLIGKSSPADAMAAAGKSIQALIG